MSQKQNIKAAYSALTNGNMTLAKKLLNKIVAEDAVNIEEPVQSTINFINLTPHDIVVKSKTGKSFTFPPSGKVARVDDNLHTIDHLDYNGENIILFDRVYGSVIDLPPPQQDTYYIVTQQVLVAVKQRSDVLAPATSNAERNDKGLIVSVPGFVVA